MYFEIYDRHGFAALPLRHQSNFQATGELDSTGMLADHRDELMSAVVFLACVCVKGKMAVPGYSCRHWDICSCGC